MDKDYFIKLTSNLYRLTLLFPKKEPLRYTMRETANNVMTNLLVVLRSDIKESKDLIVKIENDLEVLSGYFSVAKNQNWVSPFDLLEVEEEYDKIKNEIVEISGALKSSDVMQRGEVKKEVEIKSYPKKPSLINNLSERQGQVVKLLKDRGNAQIWEIQEVFSDVTKRTIRRDLKDLYDKGIVERKGSKNETFYELKES